jgi:phage recombination protein Bet
MSPSDTLVAPAVTAEQADLVKRTVAPDATADELKLYLFDCARQGVHPLDKLIHFTKRGGRYTPITGIDFMRTRAGDTGECAGIDDAIFTGTPKGADFAATVTVFRLVQGQRCAFSATARWSEYCPQPGQDHMWRKMPHTMLGKCAEALALRKGFPRQLAGLYAREELDQADVERPADGKSPVAADAQGVTQYVEVEAFGKPTRVVAVEPKVSVDALEAAARAVVEQVAPADALRVVRVNETTVKSKKDPKREFPRFLITLSDGRQPATLSGFMASLAKQYMEDNTPVKVKLDRTATGHLDLVAISPADAEPDAPPTDSEIPF